MTPRARALACAIAWASAIATAGCRTATDPAPAAQTPRREFVEIYSWWSAPGEAEALEALIGAHLTANPDARIFNAAADSGTKAREGLDDRLARNEPPDIFQEYVHELRAVARRAVAKHEPLDDLVDELDLRRHVFPEVIADVTREGHVYALPVNVHRENSLLYNRRVFAEHHLTPPRTLAEFLEACRRLKAAGVIPVATADQGWILRIMFNSLAMGRMGSVAYRDYFLGREPADRTHLREAIDVFAEVMENYINPDAGDEGFGWTHAAQSVMTGDAAMFLHGDWAKGYFVQLGWSGDSDFGIVGAPGASELFLYGVDAFALTTGARNPEGARRFLRTVVSPEGQVAFNRVKGSSPIRADVPRAELDQLGRDALDDLEHAKIRMLVRSRPVWEDALVAFTRDHDRAKLLQAFLDAPPATGG